MRPCAAPVSIGVVTTGRTAAIVIIGGGVTGASTAFHLTRRGITDVIVVDKGALASGGTGKSSACVRQHYSTAETCRMIRYSLDFFQRFAEHTDEALTAVGYTAEQIAALRRSGAIA